MGLQGVVDGLANTTEWLILKVDISNAFNCVDRKAMLQSSLQHAPGTFNYLKYAYSQNARSMLETEPYPVSAALIRGARSGL
jgi:hypothetical protein